MTQGWVIAYVVQWGVIIGLIILVINILKMVGDIYNKMESDNVKGKGLNSEYTKKNIPSFSLDSWTTEGKIEPNNITDKGIFVFVSPTCQGCKKLIEDFVKVNIEPGYQLFVLAPDGDKEGLEFYRKNLKKVNIPFAVSTKVVNEFEAPYYPFMLIVDSNRNIISAGLSDNLNLLFPQNKSQGVS